MKRIFILACIVFLCQMSNAQTKKIAHRSHSGSNKAFMINGESNFGVVRYSLEDNKKRDSLRKDHFKKDSTKRALRADSLKKASPKIPIVKKRNKPNTQTKLTK